MFIDGYFHKAHYLRSANARIDSSIIILQEHRFCDIDSSNYLMLLDHILSECIALKYAFYNIDSLNCFESSEHVPSEYIAPKNEYKKSIILLSM